MAEQATATEIEEEVQQPCFRGCSVALWQVGNVKQGGAALVGVREKACMAIWNLGAHEMNQHKFCELDMVRA